MFRHTISNDIVTPGAFQSQSFAHTAVGVLRELILSGEFGPGERLNEQAIAEQLNISRSPIREALRALSGEGLVRFVAGRGAFVTDFDAQSVREIGEVRTGLESWAARLAAERATPEAIARIEAVLAATSGAIDDGSIASRLRDTDTAIQSGSQYPDDLDFHRAVVDSADNAALSHAVNGVATQLRLARARTGREVPWARIAYEEHTLILDAIRQHDLQGAADAMADHLVKSMNRTIEYIKAHGTAD